MYRLPYEGYPNNGEQGSFRKRSRGVRELRSHPPLTVCLVKSRADEWEEWGADVIFGRARGFKASAARTVLRVLSWGFRLGVKTRLSLFRNRFIHERNLGALVISVGNITMGGTGKTTVVELLAKT